MADATSLDGPTPTAAADPQTRAVRVGTAVLAVYACWRVTIGVDVGDGGHVVALAVRMARGDVPFVDEMNAQALGSLLAVPFTWVWINTVGLDGVVLASRLFYLVLAFAAGHVAYRALRTGFRPVPAAVAVAVALVPTPYNLLVVSYNTVPLVSLAVAVAAGYAAVVRGDRRWGALCGGAVVLAAVSHPAMLPGALVVALAVIVQSRDRRVAVALVAAMGVAAAIVVAWLVVGPGLDEVAETLRYTNEYQRLERRPGGMAKLEGFVRSYGRTLRSWRYVPMWLLIVAASLLPLRRVRVAATFALPFAAAVPSFVLLLTAGREDAVGSIIGTLEPLGAASGTFAIIVAGAMTIPVVVWVARSRHRDLAVLIGIALPLAVVNTPVLAMLTGASPPWGSAVVPVTPLLGVLVLGVLTMIDGHWPHARGRLAARAGTALLVLVLAVQSLYSFRNGPPWQADARVTGGANAFLVARPDIADLDARLRELMPQWVCPGEGILVQGLPPAYLAIDAPMDTNIIWLARFRAANQTTVDWFERRGRQPDVVFIAAGLVSLAGGWEALAAEDPLVAYVEQNYGEPVEAEPFVIARLRPRSC